MMLKRIPFGIWSYSDAIHENVVAYKQRVLHRSGWNLKRLNVKCDDEQSNSHDGCHRRNKLDGTFPVLCRLLLQWPFRALEVEHDASTNAEKD
jgi:hypothetical protein